MRRIYRWETVDSVRYAYHDGTLATEAEWDAQCRRWDEMQAERERQEEEKLAEAREWRSNYCFPHRRVGGVNVDAAGNVLGYRSEASRRFAHRCGE